MKKQKPVPIKLLNPKFENLVKGRDYDLERKLKKLIKQESKRASQKLGKDYNFLSEVKEKDEALLEEERAEMYWKASSFFQEQEHDSKSRQLEKAGRG
ncbi:hypothetical protein F0562_033015 [Nyssa sinensis]|uniref:Uncharacterized protein n=1 Tax=Nyssa sinensis TaxID=561372 RepID=A0A5J5ARK0_9ASTE|nr:hypothetical protein F0562_033015 [Nyssa sinensis]